MGLGLGPERLGFGDLFWVHYKDPLQYFHTRDPNIKALKRRGSINPGSTLEGFLNIFSGVPIKGFWDLYWGSPFVSGDIPTTSIMTGRFLESDNSYLNSKSM